MINSIQPDPADWVLDGLNGKRLHQRNAAGLLFHCAFLLAQSNNDAAFPEPSALDNELYNLLDSLRRTRKGLNGTRQSKPTYRFAVYDRAGAPAVMPEDGRIFAHLCDTAGEDWSAFFSGLLRRDAAGEWEVDLGVLSSDSKQLLATYAVVHPIAAPGAPDPALVEYWRDKQTRKGSSKLDAVLGLDRSSPIVLEIKTSMSREEPDSLDAWRLESPAEADRLAGDAQRLADDLRRPVRQALLFLSGRTGRGMYEIDRDVIHPNHRPDGAPVNVVKPAGVVCDDYRVIFGVVRR